MFPTRYFCNRYFAPRYWCKVGATALALIGAVEGQTFVSGAQFGAGQVYVSGSIEGQVMVAGQQSGALYG